MDKKIPETVQPDEFLARYLEQLGLAGTENQDRRERAWERAHDIRKFEIELYWKRSTYFWGFQAAFFAGLIIIIAGIAQGFSGEFKIVKFMPFTFPVFLIAIVGWGASIIWSFVALGAKAWQDNWERHLDLLESEFSGNLYKTYVRTDDSAPYSVSSANSLMTLLINFSWSLIIVSVLFAWLYNYLGMSFAVIIAIILFLFEVYLIKILNLLPMRLRMTNPGKYICEYRGDSVTYYLSRRRGPGE